MQLVERKQCSAGTEPWLGTSIYALQALHQKLDVANPAAIDLYIDAFLALPSLTAALAIDFFARQKRRFDGREIHFLFVDLGLHLMDELPSQLLVSGRITHLYEGLAFPIVGSIGIIAKRMRQTDRQFTLIALWSQSQINPEDRPFRRGATKDLCHLL